MLQRKKSRRRNLLSLRQLTTRSGRSPDAPVRVRLVGDSEVVLLEIANRGTPIGDFSTVSSIRSRVARTRAPSPHEGKASDWACILSAKLRRRMAVKLACGRTKTRPSFSCGCHAGPQPHEWCASTVKMEFLTCTRRWTVDQYSFLGGNDRFICLCSRATAAAFFLLRLAVGAS